MRKMGMCVALAVSALSTSAPAAGGGQAEWLFAHTADEIDIQGGNTLSVPMAREIFAFIDRPDRAHQYLNAHEFIALWNDGNNSFRDDPPNAVLTWVADGEMYEAGIELLEAAVTDYGRSIIYRIDMESGVELPDELSRVSLFVDSMFLSQTDNAIETLRENG